MKYVTVVDCLIPCSQSTAAPTFTNGSIALPRRNRYRAKSGNSQSFAVVRLLNTEKPGWYFPRSR